LGPKNEFLKTGITNLGGGGGGSSRRRLLEAAADDGAQHRQGGTMEEIEGNVRV
jgi:hypothetical protein